MQLLLAIAVGLVFIHYIEKELITNLGRADERELR